MFYPCRDMGVTIIRHMRSLIIRRNTRSTAIAPYGPTCPGEPVWSGEDVRTGAKVWESFVWQLPLEPHRADDPMMCPPNLFDKGLPK